MGDSFFEGGDCRPGGDSRLIKKSTGSVGDLPGASSGKTIWIGLRLRSIVIYRYQCLNIKYFTC